jgi:hypothetical protein
VETSVERPETKVAVETMSIQAGGIGGEEDEAGPSKTEARVRPRAPEPTTRARPSELRARPCTPEPRTRAGPSEPRTRVRSRALGREAERAVVEDEGEVRRASGVVASGVTL